MKTTIALIGALEPIGTAIAKNLANQNYRLLLLGSEKREINKLVREIKRTNFAADVECHSCVVDASWEADIIISAVSADAGKQMAEKIRSVATQKIVMVIYEASYPHNGANMVNNGASEDLQQGLPNSRIVKVFASAAPTANDDIATQKQIITCSIVGNDALAVQTVTQIVKAAGFTHVNGTQLTLLNT